MTPINIYDYLSADIFVLIIIALPDEPNRYWGVDWSDGIPYTAHTHTQRSQINEQNVELFDIEMDTVSKQ